MERYDVTPINGELKKALAATENDLEKEVNNLLARFKEYEDEVVKMANLTKATDLELDKIRSAMGNFQKAFDLIKQILNASATEAEKIKMLKEVVA